MPLWEWSNLRNYVERRVLLLRIIAKRESRTALARPGSTRLSLCRGDARSSFRAMGKVRGRSPNHDTIEALSPLLTLKSSAAIE